MTNYTTTIKEICEARGHDKVAQDCCFCEWVLEDIPESTKRIIEYVVSGWLMEPETLKAYWGEKIHVFDEYDFGDACQDCSYEYGHGDVSKYLEYCWQYHGSEIIKQGLSLEDTLAYFEHHKTI